MTTKVDEVDELEKFLNETPLSILREDIFGLAFALFAEGANIGHVMQLLLIAVNKFKQEINDNPDSIDATIFMIQSRLHSIYRLQPVEHTAV